MRKAPWLLLGIGVIFCYFHFHGIFKFSPLISDRFHSHQIMWHPFISNTLLSHASPHIQHYFYILRLVSPAKLKCSTSLKKYVSPQHDNYICYKNVIAVVSCKGTSFLGDRVVISRFGIVSLKSSCVLVCNWVCHFVSHSRSQTSVLWKTRGEPQVYQLEGLWTHSRCQVRRLQGGNLMLFILCIWLSPTHYKGVSSLTLSVCSLHVLTVDICKVLHNMCTKTEKVPKIANTDQQNNIYRNTFSTYFQS